MASGTPCEQALDIFGRQDFAAWRGLPLECPVTEVLQRFAPQDDWIGAGQLGSEHVAAGYRYCRVPSYETPVRVWIVDDRVVELEAMDLAAVMEVQKLTGALGEPAARLDSYLGVIRVEKGEWVYPERGLAFSTDLSGQHVSRLAAFAPTDVQGYVQGLRVKTRATPLQEAGDQ